MPNKTKMRQEKRKKRGGEKGKVKVKTISKFCFLRMPKLRKLIFCN